MVPSMAKGSSTSTNHPMMLRMGQRSCTSTKHFIVLCIAQGSSTGTEHRTVLSLAQGSTTNTKHRMVLSMVQESSPMVLSMAQRSSIRHFLKHQVVYDSQSAKQDRSRPKLAKKIGSKFVGGNRPKSNDFGGSNPVYGTSPFLGLSVGCCGPLDPALKPHCLSRFPLPRTITCGVMLDRDPYAPCGLYFSRANDVSMRLVS